MSNVLSTEKREQVVALGRLGWPLRRIEQTTGVRRETASAYLRAAGIPIWPPGSWGRRPAKPANEVTTDPEAENPVSAESSAPPPSPPSGSSCEPYRETIQQALERGRNAMAIWQDLVTDHGFAGSYESVKRFVRKLRGVRSPEAVGIIQTGAGEEAQVDYGTGPMVRDPKTGKYRRTRLFVMTLGYSRKSVRLLTFKSSSRIWAQLRETAFRRLGGTPRLIVLDNLREGVIVPDHYDPTLNPLFRDVLTHYGVVAMPCRVRDPDRKGKVESGVGHAQKTPLKGQRFESLDQAQTEAMAPIDLVSRLVSDELDRRSIRLLERRRKQARFRDPQKTLDSFDFTFNKKMNRSLVFDLATGAFISRHDDALFLGPPGTGKSHLAQAIGLAAIEQGYRVVYRETHALLDDIAEATIDGTRKECMEALATVPLLIIDDLGMRKLPPTAAEELLEIVMRRYERTSTLLTSNRPVQDWGKLLGDSAAVTAMLDRLLHHGHILKCGPRSWRTKTGLPSPVPKR